MSLGTKDINEVLKALPQSSTISRLLGFNADGDFLYPSLRSVENYVFNTVSNSEDLDNPTTRGIYNVNESTPITRPTKGTGWQFGYVLNLAGATGVQIWFNFSGYIAIRGKGNPNSPWSDWSVMAKM